MQNSMTHPSLKRKVLVLCGPSSSGKNFLQDSLLTQYPNLFKRWTQYTNRQMRPHESQGNPYNFVSKEEFLKLSTKLCGRIGIKNVSDFNAYYGSLPVFEDGKISTVILSQEGLEDYYYNYTSKDENKDIDTFVLCLDIPNGEYVDEGRNRTLDFLENERKSLKPYVHFTHLNSKNNRLEPNDVLELLNYFNFYNS